MSNDVKKEVLKQVVMDIPLIDNSKWINNKIELIRTSIKQLDIGDNDFLYDNAKYFHRLYSYKNESIGKYSIWDEKYDDVFGFNRPFTKKSGKVCFSRYIDDYLLCKYSKPDKFSDKWQKPLNYMNNVINIRKFDEDCACFWIAEEIINAMFLLKNILIMLLMNMFIPMRKPRHLRIDILRFCMNYYILIRRIDKNIILKSINKNLNYWKM